jgi:hypothetical protein
MSSTQTFRELTYTMRPQDPHGDGTGLRFETGEHGGDYSDNMPPGDSDAQGRWAVYVPLRVNGKIVVPQRIWNRCFASTAFWSTRLTHRVFANG